VDMKTVSGAIFVLLLNLLIIKASGQPLEFSGQSTEYNMGPLWAFRQNVEIRLNECEKNWRLTSGLTAECVVLQYVSQPTFLIQANRQLTTWSYDSGEAWRLFVEIERLAGGFKVKIVGENKMPTERLKFYIAQKYIRSALAAWGKNQFTQIVMRTAGNAENNSEILLGPIYRTQREVNLSSPQLLNSCIKNLKEGADKSHCVLHFATYRDGEIILSQENLLLSSESANKTKKLVISAVADSGWQNLGPFSLAYVRVDYTGQYNESDFRALFNEAIQRAGRNTFVFEQQKIGAQLNSGAIFTESIVGRLNLSERQVVINTSDCRQQWQKKLVAHGQCNVRSHAPGYLLGEPKPLFNYSINGSAGVGLVIVTPSATGYVADVYGAEALVSSPVLVEKYLKEALNRYKNDSYTSHSLLVTSP